MTKTARGLGGNRVTEQVALLGRSLGRGGFGGGLEQLAVRAPH